MKDRISDLIRDFSRGYIRDAGNPFYATSNSRILTKLLPATFRNNLDLGNKYTVKGSVGNGNWSEIPWLAILDNSVTTTTTKGYYVVLLFDKTMEYLFICLAIGWTQFQDEYGNKEGRLRIQATGAHYAHNLSSMPVNFLAGPIDLGARNSLGKGYEQGQIISKKYSIDSIEDASLLEDISTLISSYKELRSVVGNSILNLNIDITDHIKDVQSFRRIIATQSFSDNVPESMEELIRVANLASPKVSSVLKSQIVRNRKFADFVKERSNYICEVCGRKPFVQRNGRLYAEADHIIPLGKRTRGSDSPDNMRCVCSQCHAVVTHGSEKELQKLFR